jgi:hypothetical protein
VSSRILTATVRELGEMDLDEVIAFNLGCELQWRMGLRGVGAMIRVGHTVDYLTVRETS